MREDCGNSVRFFHRGALRRHTFHRTSMNARPMPSAAISSTSVATPPPDLVAIRSGSPSALAAVYHEHAPAMLTLAYRLTASRADAEDVVHDVFVALPEALARYEERGQFRAWLSRLTTRVALMHQRRQSRLVGDDALESLATMGAAEHDVLFADRVQQSLRSLSPSLRQVFVLRVLYDHSHAEIAELLGIAINTSEVRLHRAVQQLRRVLEGVR
jgi:RNA polymerase sigma-70 factor, ECF subfamily